MSWYGCTDLVTYSCEPQSHPPKKKLSTDSVVLLWESLGHIYHSYFLMRCQMELGIDPFVLMPFPCQYQLWYGGLAKPVSCSLSTPAKCDQQRGKVQFTVTPHCDQLAEAPSKRQGKGTVKDSPLIALTGRSGSKPSCTGDTHLRDSSSKLDIPG